MISNDSKIIVILYIHQSIFIDPIIQVNMFNIFLFLYC